MKKNKKIKFILPKLKTNQNKKIEKNIKFYKNINLQMQREINRKVLLYEKEYQKLSYLHKFQGNTLNYYNLNIKDQSSLIFNNLITKNNKKKKKLNVIKRINEIEIMGFYLSDQSKLIENIFNDPTNLLHIIKNYNYSENNKLFYYFKNIKIYNMLNMILFLDDKIENIDDLKIYYKNIIKKYRHFEIILSNIDKSVLEAENNIFEIENIFENKILILFDNSCFQNNLIYFLIVSEYCKILLIFPKPEKTILYLKLIKNKLKLESNKYSIFKIFLAKIYKKLGFVFNIMGKFKTSILYCNKSINLANELELLNLEMENYDLIAKNYFNLDQLERAQEFHNKSFEYTRNKKKQKKMIIHNKRFENKNNKFINNIKLDNINEKDINNFNENWVLCSSSENEIDDTITNNYKTNVYKNGKYFKKQSKYNKNKFYIKNNIYRNIKYKTHKSNNKNYLNFIDQGPKYSINLRKQYFLKEEKWNYKISTDLEKSKIKSIINKLRMILKKSRFDIDNLLIILNNVK